MRTRGFPRTRLCALLLMVAAVGGLAGCLKTEEHYTLNADGSGKVRYKITMPFVSVSSDQQKKQRPERERAGAMARSLMENSKGVAAWKSISYRVTDEREFVFQGTAYFEDFSDLKLSGPVHEDEAKPTFTRRDDGSLVLRLPEAGRFDDDVSEKTKQLAKKDIDKAIKRARAEFKQQMRFMEAMLKDLRIERSFDLPGDVTDSSVFERVDDSTVRVVFEGQKVLKVLKELAETDAWWRPQLTNDTKAGKRQLRKMNEKLFGEAGWPRAEVAEAEGRQFDFEAELAAAKREQKLVMEALPEAKEGDITFGPGPGGAMRSGGSSSGSVKIGGSGSSDEATVTARPDGGDSAKPDDDGGGDVNKAVDLRPFGGTTNLVDKIDPGRHGVIGEWWKEDDHLFVARARAGRGGGWARLMVPAVPRGSYELKTIFERDDNPGHVDFLLPVGKERVLVMLGKDMVGLQRINGRLARHNATRTKTDWLPGLNHVLIQVRVKGDRAEVTVWDHNGKLTHWKGKQSELSRTKAQFKGINHPKAIGLRVAGTKAEFLSIRVRMLDGELEKLWE